jgi:ubiquinone/menaquinone biosynthesis C-methylase UbiE
LEEKSLSNHRSTKYDSIANNYNRRYEENDYGGIQQHLLAFVDKQTEGVLEVGCGTGHWLAELNNKGYKAIGLEPNPYMLEVARRKLPKTVLVQGQAETLPWKEETFNRVFCINAIHHFSDSEKFISETRRVLKKNGGLMIVGLDPNSGLDSWWIYDYYPQVFEIDKQRFIPAVNLRRMMINHGFIECHTVEAQHMQITLPAYDALERGLLAKTSTSQLALLTDEEYNHGINQIRFDIQKFRAEGKTLNIGLDLRIFATSGWLR